MTQSPSCTLICFPLGIKYSLLSPFFIFANPPPHPFDKPAEFYGAVYLADHGLFFRLSGLKQFSDPRQTSCNILCFGDLPGDLRKHVPGMDRRPLLKEDMRPCCKEIPGNHIGPRDLDRLVGLILNGDPGPESCQVSPSNRGAYP